MQFKAEPARRPLEGSVEDDREPVVAYSRLLIRNNPYYDISKDKVLTKLKERKDY